MPKFKVCVTERQMYEIIVEADNNNAAIIKVKDAVKVMTCADMMSRIDNYNEDEVAELGVNNISYINENTVVHEGSELIEEDKNEESTR